MGPILRNLVWLITVTLCGVIFQAVLYVSMAGDPAGLLAKNMGVWIFNPSILTYLIFASGSFALIFIIADLRWNFIGTFENYFQGPLGTDLETGSEKGGSFQPTDLEIRFEEGGSYQQWEPDDANPQLLLHRISVHNKLPDSPVPKVRVELSEFEGTEKGVEGMPFDLHITGQDHDPKCYDTEIDLDGNQTAFFDVLYLPKREYGEGCFLSPARKWPSKVHIPLSGPSYKIKIKVFANGSKYCEKIYGLKKLY